MINLRIPILLLAWLLVLSGCATLPEDSGRKDVQRLVASRTGQVPASADADIPKLVSSLLSQPLTAGGAGRVALLNNPSLQAEYASLGIAAAEVYNAGRLANPGFSLSVMVSDESSTPNQVTFGLAQSFTDLLLLSARSRLANSEFERAKLEVGAAVIDLVADVEVAYYNLVGAQQVATMRGHVAKAADASATLAQRFFDAGNINALDLALEYAVASQAKLERIQAEAATVAARNALNRLLGLGAGDDRWVTSDQLPLPVTKEDELSELLALAGDSRLDLLAKRAQVALLADKLGFDRQFRYVGDITVGIDTERETDRSRITGPNLSLELPIFNTGAGRIAQAEALVDQAEAQLQTLALAIGNDVQLAHSQVLVARELLEQYRDSLLPQREAIVRLTQQEVNYMLEGQFQLLLVKQQEFDAFQAYLEALRDYWVARTELGRAVGTKLPSGKNIESETVGPSLFPDSPAQDMKHMHHGTGGMKGMESMDHSGMTMGPTELSQPKIITLQGEQQ
ncbi:MAG: TolC family protein [Halioglobus sp.]|nr:TolC family protein [Halioglobus sp.]